jgi:CBS domain-containing protein
MRQNQENRCLIRLANSKKEQGSATMKVEDIIRIKGNSVKMIKPTETVGSLSRQLQQARIGAMVVSSNGQKIDGIISERDIAYSLAERRGDLHLLPVSALMTREVVTCSPASSLTDAARLMKKHNIRHLPVKSGDQIAGLISIRDVLEHRIDEIERKSSLVMRLFAASS